MSGRLGLRRVDVHAVSAVSSTTSASFRNAMDDADLREVELVDASGHADAGHE